MFNKLNVPTLGLVENMSMHTCSKCGHQEAIFGQQGGLEMAENYAVPLLAQLPLDASIHTFGCIKLRLKVNHGEGQTRHSYLIQLQNPVGTSLSTRQQKSSSSRTESRMVYCQSLAELQGVPRGTCEVGLYSFEICDASLQVLEELMGQDDGDCVSALIIRDCTGMDRALGVVLASPRILELSAQFYNIRLPSAVAASLGHGLARNKSIKTLQLYLRLPKELDERTWQSLVDGLHQNKSLRDVEV
jgi:hypothetical protein